MAERLDVVQLVSFDASLPHQHAVGLEVEGKSDIGETTKHGKELDDEAAYGDAPVLPMVASSPEVATQTSRWTVESILAWLGEEVDRDAASGPLAAFCFMTVSPCSPTLLVWLLMVLHTGICMF